MDGGYVSERLAQVGEDAPPEPDPGQDRDEAIVQQHEVRRLARDIGAALAHGDADMGGLQCGRIVDPVSGHRHHRPTGLQCFDDGELLFGHDAGEHVHALHPLLEGVLRERGKFRAGQGACLAFDPGLPGNGERGCGIIAGDHHHRDAGAAGLRNGAGNIRTHRIREGDQAAKGEGPVLGRLRSVLCRPARHRQHPQPLRRQAGDVAVEIGVLARGEPAQMCDRLRRALGGEQEPVRQNARAEESETVRLQGKGGQERQRLAFGAGTAACTARSMGSTGWGALARRARRSRSPAAPAGGPAGATGTVRPATCAATSAMRFSVSVPVLSCTGWLRPPASR